MPGVIDVRPMPARMCMGIVSLTVMRRPAMSRMVHRLSLGGIPRFVHRAAVMRVPVGGVFRMVVRRGMCVFVGHCVLLTGV